MPLSAVFLVLVLVLVKSALIAGGTFYVTFVFCCLFPTAGRFLVRLLGVGK